MAFSVQMPALGESVTEGTITRWLKQVGDTVQVDEPLLEVSTDKVDTEIPSPAAGTLSQLLAGEDDTIDVGGDLAVIDDGSGDGSASGGQSQDQPQSEQQGQPQQHAEPQQEPQQQAEQPAPQQAPAGDAGQGTPVQMPALGESVTEGTITRWLKQVGDTVDVDEPLLEVSTDKVDTEVPSPIAGTVLELSANEDDTVEVGGQLAVVGSGAPAQAPAPQPEPQPEPQQQGSQPQQQQAPAPQQQAPQPPAQPEQPPQQASAPQQSAQPSPQPQQQAGSTGAQQAQSDGQPAEAPYVTPLVRKLANENDIDLSTLRGSGVGGRIRKQDVQAAIDAKQQPAPSQQAPAAQPQAPAAGATAQSEVRPELAELRGTTQKASRIRQITAQKTKESLDTTAQLTQTFEVDMTGIANLRARTKSGFAEREGVKLTFLPFFAKAVVEALKLHPNVNASYDEPNKQITYHGAEHLGIAVDTEQGLLSPVIHNAGDLSIGGLARGIADIANRARSNDLKPDELTGGTFTITNIGSEGALFDTPILVPPQAGMLGTGVIVKRPVVVSGADGSDAIAIRAMCYLPLTYDHRLVDGADAGRFLTTIKKRLEEANFGAELGL